MNTNNNTPKFIIKTTTTQMQEQRTGALIEVKTSLVAVECDVLAYPWDKDRAEIVPKHAIVAGMNASADGETRAQFGWADPLKSFVFLREESALTWVKQMCRQMCGREDVDFIQEQHEKTPNKVQLIRGQGPLVS